jgi:hypothetical protein
MTPTKVARVLHLVRRSERDEAIDVGDLSPTRSVADETGNATPRAVARSILGLSSPRGEPDLDRRSKLNVVALG